MNVHSRPFQNVDAAVAEPSCGRIYEAGGIKPAVDSTLPGRQIAVADAVGHAAKAVRIGWVGIVERRGEVLTGHQIGNPNQSPSPKDLIYCAGRVAHEP